MIEKTDRERNRDRHRDRDMGKKKGDKVNVQRGLWQFSSHTRFMYL